MPADPLGDLRTSHNKLSVFEVEDRSNVDRILAALAAGGMKLSSKGFVLFDSELLAEIGIEIEASLGQTDDEKINSWHKDLINLSGHKLVKLARAILTTGESGTVLE